MKSNLFPTEMSYVCTPISALYTMHAPAENGFKLNECLGASASPTEMPSRHHQMNRYPPRHMRAWAGSALAAAEHKHHGAAAPPRASSQP